MWTSAYCRCNPDASCNYSPRLLLEITICSSSTCQLKQALNKLHFQEKEGEARAHLCLLLEHISLKDDLCLHTTTLHTPSGAVWANQQQQQSTEHHVCVLTALSSGCKIWFAAGRPIRSCAICNSSCGERSIGGTTSISVLKDLCDT